MYRRVDAELNIDIVTDSEISAELRAELALFEEEKRAIAKAKVEEEERLRRRFPLTAYLQMAAPAEGGGTTRQVHIGNTRLQGAGRALLTQLGFPAPIVGSPRFNVQ